MPEIVSKVELRSGYWYCLLCGYCNRIRARTLMHIEAIHTGSNGYYCSHCNKFCPSKNALSTHISRYHRNKKYA